MEKMIAFCIQEIMQLDHCTFRITWTDGKVIDYRLAELQARCPCASCLEKKQNRIKLSIPADLKAIRITNVGRYALKIEFTSGCSMGIYGFDMLYSWTSIATDQG